MEEYALSLHAARIFEDPAWADYVPFNRQYRPEILETAKLVWIKTSCCPKAGQITEKQLEKAVYMGYRIRCPHCGRFGDFHVCTLEELQEEKEM